MFHFYWHICNHCKIIAHIRVCLEELLFHTAPKGTLFRRLVDKAEKTSDVDYIMNTFIARTHAEVAVKSALIYFMHLLFKKVRSHAY